MIDQSYLFIILAFILYYFLVLFFEKKLMHNPKDIVEKFLAVILIYAGISLIYFSFTGKPFLKDNISSYYVYIFMIGFIAMVWAIPTLLSEFNFFKKFMKKKK